MADLNLDGLRPDQLEKIKTGAVSGLNADQIAAMADIFREDNTTLSPEQAPPAPGAPLPSGLVPGGYLADLTKSVPGVAPIKRSQVEEYKKAHEFLQGGIDAQNKAAVKALAYRFSAGRGLPWWLQGVNTAATDTPGDLATLVATMGLGGAVQGMRSGVRAINIPLRAAQGLGIYGVGKTVNDVTNGRPVKFGLQDLLLGGLSAGLGGMQGAIEAPSTKVSPLDLWKSHQAKVSDIENQIAQGQEAVTKAKEAVKPAKFTADEAKARLAQFEQDLARRVAKDKFKAKMLERLQVNENAPGATPADLQDLATKRKLSEVARAAAEAHQEAQMTPERLNSKLGTLNTQLTELKNAAPEKPGVLSLSGRKLIHAVLPALGGTGFGGLVHTAPLAGTLGGAATDALLSTEAGQKLLAFLSKTVGSNGLNTIPSIVNQSSKK